MSHGCSCHSCDTHAHDTPSKIDSLKPYIIAGGAFIYVIAIIINLEGVYGFLLFFSAYLILGGDIVLKAVKNIFEGKFFDENFLMSVSTIGAFCIGEFKEAVAVMLFYQVGEILQERAANKSRKSIKQLMDIKVEYANVLENGNIIKKDPKDVLIGSLVLVKPGERFPLDGVVAEGSSRVDTSPLTGETIPLEVSTGSNVLSGYINSSGAVTVKTTTDYKNSTVAKIMDLVENAKERKAPTERFITQFSKIYTPIVVAAAILLALVPPLVLKDGFSIWVHRALVFLVVSCPCALVVSVPLSFFSGIGMSAKRGVLAKGGNILQTLSQINTVVFDKTGTLTKGVFQVIDIVPQNNISKQKLLETAYMAEKLSNHPISLAISAEYEASNGTKQQKPEEYEEKAGMGIVACFNGANILAGNSKLMEAYGIKAENPDNSATIAHIAENNNYLGYIIVSDTLREGSKAAVQELKNAGIKYIAMLTGDNKKTASSIAGSLGLDAYSAELLPGGKVNELENIYKQNTDAKVLFVGDGINDAPVLARADVGVAMGGIGSDAAVEAADLVILNDEPEKIPVAIKVARHTMVVVRQNIAFTLIVKFLTLFLAAIGVANMWMAVFADVGVTLLVVLNAVRMNSRRI